MKKIKALEKKYIPTLRKSRGYIIAKGILLFPYILFLYLQERYKSRPTKESKAIVLQNIVTGFSNLIFNDPEVEALATQRAKICASCPFAQKAGMYSMIVDNKTTQIQGMKCAKCGCNLSAKVRSVADRCPLNKW